MTWGHPAATYRMPLYTCPGILDRPWISCSRAWQGIRGWPQACAEGLGRGLGHGGVEPP